MDDELSDPLKLVGSEPVQLKFGSTFSGKGPGFHTLRYDFKPASVDVNKPASVDIDPSNREVTVTVPNFEGAGAAHTVFKGSHKDYTTKECVLIIDHATGEITLEKLTTNVQLKTTRNAVEKPQKPIVKFNPVMPENNIPTTVNKQPKSQAQPTKKQPCDDLVPAARDLELSESSSDSESSSSSDSDSDDSISPLPSPKSEAKQTTPTFSTFNSNGFKERLVDPERILDEDLQLSESDSD
ncbi:ELL-associated factor 2-like [Adelges cooleyi]|uniref:ELL-associated factor 2-like n=1 Tax=Adelges cooleyi TaxID=133065 RepID=UPI00217F81B7|nr:ELL-associated factor 2-like [Adelges cooleyi]